MDLRQLSYFLAVAEEGQFTRAAARVNIAQPAISAQVRLLERELGTPLFHRGPREARLTTAGQTLLPHARAALAAAERGRDSIASLRGLLHGVLRIGIAGPVDHRLAAALGDFHRAHPAVDISVSQAQNAPLLDALAEGEYDAAVVGVGAQPLPPQVRARVVATEPLVVGVSRGDPLSERRSVTVLDLRDQGLVTLVRGSGLRAVVDQACREAGFEARVVAETGDLGSLVSLVAEGLGVAVVPRSAATGADVALVPLRSPKLHRRTALAWSTAATSPAGQAFLELAGRRFSAAS